MLFAIGFVIAVAATLAATAVAAVGLTAWTAWRAERLVPPCGRFLTVEGVRLHVVDIGEGPAVVMLHGLAAQLQTYTYAMAHLLGRDHRLVMIDRPGCGHSGDAPRATLQAQARLVAGAMRALAVGPAVVVGHSLGGAVALALAVDHPERVAALALIAPATQPQDDVPTALRALAIRSEAVRWLVAWTVAVPLALWRRKATMDLLFGPDAVPDDFAVVAGAVLAARPRTFRNACHDLVEAGPDLARYAARYGEIVVPVGVLYGRDDRILDAARHGDGLRGVIADVEVEMAPGGHMPPITDPVRCARLVERMIARAGLSERAAA